MKESSFILNVPKALMQRASNLEIPENHKALVALDKGLEVILLEPIVYLAADYGAAIGNHWAETRKADTAFFMATDWPRYAKNDRSPTEYHESFNDFLLSPQLLIVIGLSYMKTAPSRATLDDVLNRRVQDGKLNLIGGWNMPEGDFKFQPGQELAADSRSEFPLLHQRSSLPHMALLTSVKGR